MRMYVQPGTAAQQTHDQKQATSTSYIQKVRPYVIIMLHAVGYRYVSHDKHNPQNTKHKVVNSFFQLIVPEDQRPEGTTWCVYVLQ